MGNFEAPVSPNGHFNFGNGIMKYIVYSDPDWAYENYNFDTLRKDSARVVEKLNATNPDLSAFRKRGGNMNHSIIS